MGTTMKKIVTALLATALTSACVGTQAAAPNLYNGYYFMAGDETCTQMRALSATRIMCTNSAGQETGYRDAMTDQQLQMYQHSEEMQAQRAAQSAAQTAAWANSMQQPYPQYSAPQVQPLSLPGSGQIRCINTGMYTNCRY